MDVGVATVQVEVDAVVAVVGEQPDLVHPRPHLLVVLAAGRRRPGQVHQEAVHALHLLPDEVDVVPDAVQQPPLAADDAEQRGHRARRELSYIASSPARFLVLARLIDLGLRSSLASNARVVTGEVARHSACVHMIGWDLSTGQPAGKVFVCPGLQVNGNPPTRQV